MSPLSTPSQQGYHVQTVQPLTFILQLPNSSVRCNCASHQPELGLLNCPHNHSFYYSIETRAGTIRLSYDTIRIAIHAMRYDTYHDISTL